MTLSAALDLASVENDDSTVQFPGYVDNLAEVAWADNTTTPALAALA